MECGDLEFSRHNEICTGRCASRNIGTSKYDVKIEQLKNNQELDNANISKYKASRRKKRIPQSLSQSSGDLASLRTLLNGPLLSDPGFTALREAQGEDASPSTPNFRNQPVFPSAMVVPADQAMKVEPTSQIDEDEDSAGEYGYDEDCKPPVSLLGGLNDKHSYGSKNGDIDRSKYLRKELPFLMNGGGIVSSNNHDNDSDEALSMISNLRFPSENNEINKEVMEAIKFANDLPDSESLLDGESNSGLMCANLPGSGQEPCSPTFSCVCVICRQRHILAEHPRLGPHGQLLPRDQAGAGQPQT
jgi:hypothetical protein